MTHPYVLKLQQRDVLSARELAVLESMPMTPRKFSAGQDMIREGDRPSESSVLLSGFCARYNEFPDGRRQITSIHVAGDFVDLHSFLLKTMDHGILALNACETAAVPHQVLARITEEHPHLTRLLWLATLIDAAIHRQWMVSAGRRSAIEHMAHLVCEIALRLKVIGEGGEQGFRLPITQAAMGDTLGLSFVHVNRVLKELRERRLMSWRGGVVTIENWTGLAALAEFDPTYLRLQKDPV